MPDNKLGTVGFIAQKIKASVVIKVYLSMLGVYAVSCILQPNYLSVTYLIDTLVMASILGILALGQTLVILTGGIDLSIIWTMNLAAVIICMFQYYGRNPLFAILVALAVSILIGVFNGMGVAYLDIPPMVMTLATQSIVYSITMVYTDGNARGQAPEWLRWLSTGYTLGLRNILIFWLIIALLAAFILGKTTFGRKLYAVGNSVSVSYLSGIRVKGMLIAVYAISGVTAMISGLVFTGYLGYSYLSMGENYELPSIAAVVIGGTSILGGKGNYTGTVAGAIMLYLVTSMLNNMQIEASGKKVIYGLIILVVLLFYNREKKIK